jgi:hypothetical protein
MANWALCCGLKGLVLRVFLPVGGEFFAADLYQDIGKFSFFSS